jgi:hypothetical protein
MFGRLIVPKYPKIGCPFDSIALAIDCDVKRIPTRIVKSLIQIAIHDIIADAYNFHVSTS